MIAIIVLLGCTALSAAAQILAIGFLTSDQVASQAIVALIAVLAVVFSLGIRALTRKRGRPNDYANVDLLVWVGVVAFDGVAVFGALRFIQGADGWGSAMRAGGFGIAVGVVILIGWLIARRRREPTS